ncbi:hypothetical protein [Fischerella sp. PCC 9605]|uniref:hypothetical protein n=1 Tax=Fischerella sp. PCC 9605 TaxID=1173024 RepID=UPI0004AD4D66|nr:hypothetical protein [Fischerella sp. PCC 9605]
MIITPQPQSQPAHPLARFVTPEAIALLLKIKIEQIKDIRLWPNVILVVAKGLTRFVSYADLPPIVEAEPPQKQDFARWRKRWKKNETKQAPEFWGEFYKHKFWQAACVNQLQTWGELVNAIKFTLCPKVLEFLRSEYLAVKHKQAKTHLICIF